MTLASNSEIKRLVLGPQAGEVIKGDVGQLSVKVITRQDQARGAGINYRRKIFSIIELEKFNRIVGTFAEFD